MFSLNIKRTLSLLFAGLFSGSVVAQDSTLKVLFIGNSYTHMYDLPGTVAACASSITNKKLVLEFDHATPGGHYWHRHAADKNTFEKIKKDKWDIVILQEQSQMLSLPDSVIAKESIPFLQALVDSIRLQNPSSKLMFYRTWGRKNGDAQNGPMWPPVATYEGMDSLLAARYQQLADSIGAQVVKVGDVWKNLRTQYPDIELYDPDGSHPSPAGTYLAAVTFAQALFGINPLEIIYDGRIGQKEALLIRKVADQVLTNGAGAKGMKSKAKTKKAKNITKAPEGPYNESTAAKPILKADEFPFHNGNNPSGSFEIGLAVLPSSSARRKQRSEKDV